MNLTNSIEFPKLNNTNPVDHLHNLILSLWEKTSLYDYKNDSINELSNDFHHILDMLTNYILKNQDKCVDIIRHSEYMSILENILCFIAHSRDIHYGFGFRKLYYSFIYVLYDSYPALTCEILPCFFLFNKKSIGSWRDGYGICLFIKEKSKIDHPLIEFMVKFINTTLFNDLNHYKKNNSTISNCAKWIPRERGNKKWLFEKLAIQWSKTYNPYLLSSPKDDNSYKAALKKCFMNYRKIVSKLSKTLPIIEQYLCNPNYNTFQFNNITENALVKNWYSLFNQTHYLCMKEHSILRDNCSQNLSSSIQTIDKKFKSLYYFDNIHFPQCISQYVYFAFRCIHVINSFTFSIPNCDKLSNEIKNLNYLWKKTFTKWDCFSIIPNNYVPIINIQVTSLSDPVLHRAIAHACFLAQGSNIKRILFCAHSPIWINIEKDDDFISMIRTIYNTLSNEMLINTDFKESLKIIHNIKHFTPIIIHQNGYCNEYDKKKTYKNICNIFNNQRYKHIHNIFSSFLETNTFNSHLSY